MAEVESLAVIPAPWDSVDFCNGCSSENCAYQDYCKWERWIDAKMQDAESKDFDIPIFAKLSLYGTFVDLLKDQGQGSLFGETE